MELKYFFKPVLIRRITSIYHYKKKRGFFHPSHVHASYGHEIIYLDYGKMNITLGNSQLVLKTGEILFIKGGVPHIIGGPDGVPFDYRNIMFRGILPEHLFNRPLSIDRTMRDILVQLKYELEYQDQDYLEMMGSLLTELVILLGRKNAPVAKKKPIDLLSNRLHYESDKVEKACEIIRKHYNEKLKEVEVAQAIQISASHLRLLLKKNLGKNFTTLLHEYRIEAAKHLIINEGQTFSEVAMRVGFESPAFFFKLFKRHTGMTPKEYAKSLG